MSIKLEWEQASVVFDEFQDLFDAHYLEIFGKSVPVKKSSFVQIEHIGSLFLLTARYEDKAIGYYAISVLPSMYNSEVLEASEIGIYIVPEHRNKGITTAMQEVMDNNLKIQNVHSVFVSYPRETSIPIKAGYKLKEITYERIL